MSGKLDKQTLSDLFNNRKNYEAQAENYPSISSVQTKPWTQPIPLPQFGTPEDSITLDQLKEMTTSPVNISSSEAALKTIVVNENNPHVKFKNTDGITKVVRKAIIDYVDFDEDEGQATVFILDYSGEVKPANPKTYLYTVEWSIYKLISQRDFGSSSTWTHEVKTKNFLDKIKAEVFLKSVTEAYNLVLPGANKGLIKTEEIED